MRIIIFKNDNDFETYAIDARGYQIRNNNGRYSYDWDFSDLYKNETANGTVFYIKDTNSKIAKRQAVTQGIISKKVSNVFVYPVLMKIDTPENEVIIY